MTYVLCLGHVIDNGRKHRRLHPVVKLTSPSVPRSASRSSSTSARDTRQLRYRLVASATPFGDLPRRPVLDAGSEQLNNRDRLLADNSPRYTADSLLTKVDEPDSSAAVSDVKRATYGQY